MRVCFRRPGRSSCDSASKVSISPRMWLPRSCAQLAKAEMRIPYVIDNQQHRLADVLNEVLAEHAGRSLDVATAYFTVTGYGLAGQAKELIEVVRKMRAALNEPAAS